MLSRSDEPPPTIERVELFFSPEDLVGTLLSDEIELSARNQVLRVPGDSVSARAGLKAGDVIVGGVDSLDALNQGGVAAPSSSRRLCVLRVSRRDAAAETAGSPVRLRVTVPKGVVGGQRVRVQTPSGPMIARVPPSLGAGDNFEVLVPEAKPYNLIQAAEASCPGSDGGGREFDSGQSGEEEAQQDVGKVLSHLNGVLKVRPPSSSVVFSEPFDPGEAYVLLRGQAVACSYGLVMLLATAVELRSMWAA